MNIERAILVGFFGNFVINNIAGAIVALLHVAPATPQAGIWTMQTVIYAVIATLFAAVFTWWHLMPTKRENALVNGIVFGVIAFLVAVITSLVSGIAGVLAQSGSFAQLAAILPNFGPFLWQWSTLILLGYWIIPAAVVGYLMGMMKKDMSAGHMSNMPRPMI